MPRVLVLVALLLAPVALLHQRRIDAESSPRSEVALASGLEYADPLTVRATKSFLRDYPALADEGLVNAVIEIPAGTSEKWEVKPDGVLRWDLKDGEPRRVNYLAYPCNYGMVPRTVLAREIGGDGDPLDVLVLGAALPRGTVAPVRVIGAIRLVDAGEKDDKLIAVRPGDPLAAASSVAELDQRFPGVGAILETWFENYKGGGALQCGGFGDPSEAIALLAAASDAFEKIERSAPRGAK
jgi:inorganic pyrophosphatase